VSRWAYLEGMGASMDLRHFSHFAAVAEEGGSLGRRGAAPIVSRDVV
jgi:hypothetical protein